MKQEFADSFKIDDYDTFYAGKEEENNKNNSRNYIENYIEDEYKRQHNSDNENSEKEYQKKLENISKKYEMYINICINEKKEENFLRSISQNLHDRIKTGKSENLSAEIFDKIYYLPGSLAQFFNQNKKYRENFDDIFYLRTEIVEKEKELREMRSRALSEFKDENRGKKAKNEEETELIYSVLFGNGIYV